MVLVCVIFLNLDANSASGGCMSMSPEDDTLRSIAHKMGVFWGGAVILKRNCKIRESH